MRLARLVCTSLLAAVPCAAQEKFVNEQFVVENVARGVYAFVAPDSESGVVQSNCTLIVGESAALLVDSGQFPSLAERMVGEVEKITDKPVRYLVNTHWHFDHVWGNDAFRRAYPGLAIVSTEFTRRMIEDEGPKTLANGPATNRREAERVRGLLASGKLSDGRPITPELGRYLTRAAATLEHIEPEFALTLHAPPTVGFEKELTIELGKREVKLLFLGRANTGGDAVVLVPDVSVLMTGDAVVWPTPFAFGSYPSEWPGVLQKMVDMNPAVIVPGHGPVMHDASYLRTLIALFSSLFAQVKQAAALGLSLDDTRKRVNLDEFKERLAGSDFFRQLAFRSAFLAPAVERAYQEATGTLKPEAES